MTIKTIFVFGSNLAGRHGKGAALYAKEKYDAVYGIGEGRTGDAYAIPTKNARLQTRSLQEIEASIVTFLDYACNHIREDDKDLLYYVTPVGTGLAGYKIEDIASIFRTHLIPTNVVFTKQWFE